MFIRKLLVGCCVRKFLTLRRNHKALPRYGAALANPTHPDSWRSELGPAVHVSDLRVIMEKAIPVLCGVEINATLLLDSLLARPTRPRSMEIDHRISPLRDGEATVVRRQMHLVRYSRDGTGPQICLSRRSYTIDEIELQAGPAQNSTAALFDNVGPGLLNLGCLYASDQ